MNAHAHLAMCGLGVQAGAFAPLDIDLEDRATEGLRERRVGVVIFIAASGHR
ncbi:MAG: hypothetical protein AAGI68_02580 [Planctomycetota bacterium]